MAILLAALVWRARNRQRNETASDRRAVELTGDGEALVRALAKLYLFARIPRRHGLKAVTHKRIRRGAGELRSRDRRPPPADR